MALRGAGADGEPGRAGADLEPDAGKWSPGFFRFIRPLKTRSGMMFPSNIFLLWGVRMALPFRPIRFVGGSGPTERTADEVQRAHRSPEHRPSERAWWGTAAPRVGAPWRTGLPSPICSASTASAMRPSARGRPSMAAWMPARPSGGNIFWEKSGDARCEARSGRPSVGKSRDERAAGVPGDRLLPEDHAP